MKKFLLYSILTVCICSCKIIKENPSVIKQIDFALKGKRMVKKMELNYYHDKKSPFIFKDNAVYVPCKINDTTHLVFFDNKASGIGTTIGLLTEEISGNVKLPKCNKTIKLKKEKKTKNSSNHRVIVKSGLKYYSVESNFFQFKNLVGVVTSQSNDTIIPICVSEKSSSKYAINDVLVGWGNAMLLSFSDTTIALFDTINTYDTMGFTLIKSMFTCRGNTVNLTIDSIEYEFVFNMASKGFLSLPQDAKYQKCSIENGRFRCDFSDVQYEKHKKKSDISINYVKRNTANNLVIDTLIVQQTNTIRFGDLDSMEGNICYQKIDRPIMGMAFISQFDWIIDSYKGKIYAKKIKNTEFTNTNYYQVNVFDSTLQISCLPIGETEYQLFSIIDSVNGEKVNAENICQMQELLNRPNGFKENKLIILPQKK